jgi:hypothetical protein
MFENLSALIDWTFGMLGQGAHSRVAALDMDGWGRVGVSTGTWDFFRLSCAKQGSDPETPFDQLTSRPTPASTPFWCGAFFGSMIVTLVPAPGVDAMPMLPPIMPVTTL